MCGICGIVGAGAQYESQALRAMLAKVSHRGPDAEGTHNFPNCAFGHSRLSIIDLNTGNQPMVFNSPNGDIGIVFNGEIYNYKALRDQSNQVFTTNSDTEIIPALYYEKGIAETCRSLIGMFSFALWDERNQRLICARDRFGEKPFYYSLTADHTLVFASEIQALIASGLVDVQLSEQGLAHYLALRYIPENLCIYRQIKTLEPGSYLIWENGRLFVDKYWTLPEPFAQPPSFENAVEEIRLLTKKAVSRCLVSDVEVGLLLSGGLDSTTVAALAADEKKLRTFCFGFGEKDERPFARAVAESYGLPLIDLTDDAWDLPDLIQTSCRVYGEPFADPSAIPTRLLCQRVGKEVKVALGGDGADELFGGYDYWYQPLIPLEGKKTFFSGASKVARQHWNDTIRFANKKIRKLGLPEVVQPDCPHPNLTVDDALRMDLSGFLPSDILRKVDRASMYHGLEVRSPFLDTELAEFVISLPASYKVSLTETKIVMRSAFSDLWPESIKSRGKQGFGYSVGKWLKQPEMAEFTSAYLADPRRKIFSLLPAKEILKLAMRSDKQAWSLLILAVWMEEAQWRSW